MARLNPRASNVGKVGGGITPGRRRERAGAARRMVFRHRREGDPIVDERILAEADPEGLSNNREMDNFGYVDLEHNDEGVVTTDPDTVPRG